MSDREHEEPKGPPVPPRESDEEFRSATTAHHTAMLKNSVEGGKQDGKHGSGRTGGDGGGPPSGDAKTEIGKS